MYSGVHSLYANKLNSFNHNFDFLCRETLLGQLTGYIRSVRDEFTKKSSISTHHQLSASVDPKALADAENQAPPTGKNMPKVVNDIVWIRQLESKVSETLTTAEALLGDLSEFKKFQKETGELKEELKDFQREQFDSWSRHVLAAINHPTDPLR